MSLKNYDNYIFDFDGTIANLKVDWVSLKDEIKTLCKKHGIEIKQKLNVKIDLLKDNESNLYAIIKKYEQWNNVPKYIINQSIVDFKNTKDSFYVVSNNLHSTVKSVLDELGLASKCKKIIAIDDIKNSKPDTEAYKKLKILLKIGSSLYIGDRDTDKEFARNCNIDFKHAQDMM